MVTVPSDLPDKVNQLGALLTVHQTSSIERAGAVLGGACLIGASVGLFGLMAATQMFSGKAVVLIIVLPILGSIYLVRGLWNMARRLVVLRFSDGFMRLRPGPITAWSWDQLAVYYKKSKGEWLSYTLENRDGDRITLRGSNMAWFTNLGDTIEQTIWQRCYPDARATYESGGIVRFGRLGVSRTGLLKGNKVLSWKDVAQITVDRDSNLTVSKKGAIWFWCVVPIARIQNYCIFRALVEDNIRLASYR